MLVNEYEKLIVKESDHNKEMDLHVDNYLRRQNTRSFTFPLSLSFSGLEKTKFLPFFYLTRRFDSATQVKKNSNGLGEFSSLNNQSC